MDDTQKVNNYNATMIAQSCEHPALFLIPTLCSQFSLVSRGEVCQLKEKCVHVQERNSEQVIDLVPTGA